MRLVMTLLVRDEADIVGEQIAYHLNAGVDVVIATDHESQDGTTEILESYARAGCLVRIPVSGEVVETAWRTRMARMAATEYHADWVINTDADEFWMPRGGTLKEVFETVPERFGVVWAVSRQFVPRPEDGSTFAERMVVRFSSQAALNDPTSPYRPHGKAAHRADPDIVVRHGAHRIETNSLVPLPGWNPWDVLHFPFRSLAQYGRKTARRARGDSPLGQYVRGLTARERGRLEEVYGALVVDDVALAEGVAAGSLVVDTRLRDALRGRSRVAAESSGGPDPTVADAAAFREAEVVRLVRTADDLGARLAAVERGAGARE
jgi:hypothetical protein